MLEELFFSKKMAKTIEFFIIHEKWEQNQKDLCEELDIYPEAMRDILKKLLDLGFVKVTRTIAKSRFYKLNPESDLINPLRILIQKLTLQLVLEECEEGFEEDINHSNLEVKEIDE